MKHWKSKAAALVVALFAVYVLLNHMNLNPLYPEAAFAYCVLFTLLFAIFTVDKIGRFVMQQGTGGV